MSSPGGRLLPREVVSFGRRDGRRSARHVHSWDAEHAWLRIEPERDGLSTSLARRWRLDAGAAFGRAAPLVVEIGSGTGDAVLASAARHPEWDHLAVEVYRPGAARTIALARARGLANVRVLDGDGRRLLASELAPASVTEVRVFFPDPWPKARHRKRRLVDAAVVTDVAAVLHPGGVLRLATDWEDYAQQMLHAAGACPELRNPHAARGGWAPRFAERPVTRFERKGLALGRVIRDLEFRR